MRTIERTGHFKRDWKRQIKGQHRVTLAAEFAMIVTALVSDAPLEPRHRDHALTGD
jgi:mRNA interferase YafQ